MTAATIDCRLPVSMMPCMDSTALIDRSAHLLAGWAEAMEAWWTPTADGNGLLGFGSDAWGMQTAWRHAAALTVLAERGGPRADHWRARACAAVRFLCAAHVTGEGRLLDGRQWGRTWISALPLERTWHALSMLEPHLDPATREALLRILSDEATWLTDVNERAGKRGIRATRWSHEGGNNGESNLWNGCLLWRAAERMPGHARAADWREQAHRFLLNGISIASDLQDGRVVAGKPVRERVVGPGFFDHFAFDHHGYLNLGYMVICLSHAGILHFDARQAGLAEPESLHHHQADLWAVVRRLIFADGRLARIGGDTRVRYAYCQEYLVPAALYAADVLGDAGAIDLLAGWLGTAEREASFSADGSFYRRRLDHLANASPSYYLRLESDRACALAMLMTYLPALRPATAATPPAVLGGWGDPEHGAVAQRDPQRLAAFAWRAHHLAQGTCQPPGDGNLAEWEGNLVGSVDFVDLKPGPERRKLLAHEQQSFAGGFLTWGRLALGCGCALDEGWVAPAEGQAVHHLAFAALPDGRSVLAIEVARVGALHALVRGARALHLNLPNDCFNGMERPITTAAGARMLRAGTAEGREDLASRWVQLADGYACIGLTGGTSLALERSRLRRGGAFRSLHVEEVVWGAWAGHRHAAPGSDLIDAAWLVRCGGDAADAAACAAGNLAPQFPLGPDARAVRVVLPDGSAWILALNIGSEPVSGLPAGRIVAGSAPAGVLPGHAAVLIAERQ
jgi:hypothetical protein